MQLLARAQAGDAVALVARNRTEWVETFAAAQRAGMTALQARPLREPGRHVHPVAVGAPRGNLVIPLHPDFERGVRAGPLRNHAVELGMREVIGTVGMTGMTTGPHVHYEFRVNDVHVDPLSVAVPYSFPIEPHARARFEQQKAPQARLLALLRDTSPANFE